MADSRYPLTVAFLGGSHRHRARWEPDGDTVQTAPAHPAPASAAVLEPGEHVLRPDTTKETDR